jgi:2-oxo-4-hydroxy-4-carboxy-5-ureidoimidazoline decarboxylase
VEIVEFNAMEPADAAAFVQPCAAIASFVSALVDGRPYPDVRTLLERAEQQAATWTSAEVTDALKDHPRIGERHGSGGVSAAMSAAEQSGVSADTDAVRLAEANRRYEERFGRIYLVRAKGRSTEELLAPLEQRLGNDDATEAEVVRQQLAEIAQLRLAALFEDAA